MRRTRITARAAATHTCNGVIVTLDTGLRPLSTLGELQDPGGGGGSGGPGGIGDAVGLGSTVPDGEGSGVGGAGGTGVGGAG